VKWIDAIGYIVMAVVGGPFAGLFLAVTAIWRLFKNVGTAITQMIAGEWIDAIDRLGQAVIDFILTPFAMVAKAVTKLMKLNNSPVPKWIETFGEEGVTGLLHPKETPTEITAAKAKEKQKELKAEVKVTNENKVNVDVTTKLDNREIARGQSKHELEVRERTGAKETPWQRRLSVEMGARVRT
jgi:hypothetical protein